jgi:hypothetical protein
MMNFLQFPHRSFSYCVSLQQGSALSLLGLHEKWAGQLNH